MKSYDVHRLVAGFIVWAAVYLPAAGFAAVSPSITTQPVSQSLLAGTNASFSVVASGQTPLFYQWSLNGTNLTNSAHFGGATSPNLTLTNLVATDAGNYRVVVNNSHGAATSSIAVLTVLLPPAITNPPMAQAVVLTSNATFTVSASGTAPLGYQWKKNGTSLADGGSVTGANGATLSLANVQTNDSGAYQVIVANSYGSATSAPVTLTVLLPPTIASQPASQSVLLGGNATFSSTAAGTAPLNYQWYFNGTPLADDGHISGSTGTNLSLTGVSAADVGSYQLVVTNNYGADTSAVATLTVLFPPAIVSAPTNPLVLQGSTAVFQVVASGTDPLTYHWQRNGTNLFNGGRYSGVTSPTFQIASVQYDDPGDYRVVITNPYGQTNATATLSLAFAPYSILGVQPQNQSVPLNGTATFNVDLGGTPPLTLQWLKNGLDIPADDRVSPTNYTLVLSPTLQSDAGSYSIRVSNAYGTLVVGSGTYLNPGILTVLLPPVINAHPQDQIVPAGTNATFQVSATSPNGALAYQWRFNGINLPWAKNATIILTNAQSTNTGSYDVVVSNPGGSVTSLVAQLTVSVSAPWFTAPLPSFGVGIGQTVVFNPGARGSDPLAFQWQFNGTNLPGATTATLTLGNVQTTNSGAYQVVVTNDYGANTSVVANLSVQNPILITGQPASRAALLGSGASFTVLTTGTAPFFQWYFNGAPLTDDGHISGSTTPTLTIANVQAGDAGGYVVVVTNLLSSATSRSATLTPQGSLAPSVRYVALTSTNPLPPYLDWSTAATNIQDAVDAAVAGDQVLVSNGVYQVGGRVVYGAATNRLVVDKPVTVQSVNGPGSTFIQGFRSQSTVISMRCVYLTNGASLVGLTMTNGSTPYRTGDLLRELSGGGVWCEGAGAIVSNCIIANCFAYQNGGGVFQGTLLDCLLTNNSASFGGGAFSNTLIHCTLIRNAVSGQQTAPQGGGGGAGYCSLSNCLVVANLGGNGGGAYFSALASCVVSNNGAVNGGGVFIGALNNCLISSNRASSYGGGAYSNILVNCVLQNNLSVNYGGGAAYSTLLGCVASNNAAAAYGGGVFMGGSRYSLISSNHAYLGGGAYSNALNHCVLRNNAALLNGGGAYNSSVVSCTVVSNSSGSVGNGLWGGTVTNSIVCFNGNADNIVDSKAVVYTCSFPIGSVTNDPLFIDRSTADFHLQSNSPCINAGKNSYVTNTTDFDGYPRIVGGTVDMGAYEFQSPGSTLSYAWARQYGLPLDGSADSLDADGDGLNNWQEWKAGTNPTNAASVLKMSSPSNTVSSTTIKWQSVSGVLYFLQRGRDFSAQPPFSTIQSNIVGQAGTTTYTDLTATNGGLYYYRVGVQ